MTYKEAKKLLECFGFPFAKSKSIKDDAAKPNQNQEKE